MHISNDRYFHDRRRHDLARRMIRHEARTCTIRSCTGLTDDRIRRLYKTYASHASSPPIRRHRGKSPRQVAFFIRNTQAQFESSLLASVFTAFGLLHASSDPPQGLEFGKLFCDAYETHRQLLGEGEISFEHAWFLLQLLSRNRELRAERCRNCDSQYLQDRINGPRRTCPVCALKRDTRVGARRQKRDPTPQ